jgi:hypothetical protein
MKLSLLALLFMFCISCSVNESPRNRNKLQIIQGSGELHEKWKTSVLNKCTKEAPYLTLMIFESKGRTMTKEQVQQTERFMFDSCLLHYKVYI